MLDDPEELQRTFRKRGGEIRETRVRLFDRYMPVWEAPDAPPRIVLGDLHCDRCGDARKMYARALYLPETFPDASAAREVAPPVLGVGNLPPPVEYSIAPALFHLLCTQCAAPYLLLVMKTGDAHRVLVLPELPGQCGHPHTPTIVAFYLDQARQSRAIGAFVAAITMYRAALEHLLYEQGYTKRTLGPKIQELAEAVEDGTAPQWARDLDPAYLTVIKDLGNASIHPNEGNVDDHAAVAGDLILQVDALFDEILEAVYELPAQRQERLDSLKGTAERLAGRDAPGASGPPKDR